MSSDRLPSITLYPYSAQTSEGFLVLEVVRGWQKLSPLLE